jgi:quercetin dioxygenase-like cupin family protein
MRESAMKATNGVAGKFGQVSAPAPLPTMRAKVIALEEILLAAPQAVIPVTHRFANPGTRLGVYAREIFIPKGTVLTGKIHKTEQINFMLKGDMSVLTEEGIKRVQAPFTIVSPPGTKRVAYAHEDTVWTTVHATDETDIEKIETLFVVDTEAEYLAYCEALRIEGEKKCPT